MKLECDMTNVSHHIIRHLILDLISFIHSGARLHGFLSYLVKSALNKKSYLIFGYKGKQVRDNIHSQDVVSAFDEFIKKPKLGGCVYNLGGGRNNSCSILEAINLIENMEFTLEEH